MNIICGNWFYYREQLLNGSDAIEFSQSQSQSHSQSLSQPDSQS